MDSKKKIWFVVLALMFLTVFRESGCVNLHFTNGKFTDQMQTNLYAEFYEYNGEKRELKAERKTGNYETTADDSNRSLGFHTTLQKNIFTEFPELLKQDLKPDKRVSVTIEKLELSGLYWFPLYKTGSCEYNFYVEVLNDKSIVYRGTAQGKIDFSFAGISSVTEVKEILSKKIAKITIENAKKVAK